MVNPRNYMFNMFSFTIYYCNIFKIFLGLISVSSDFFMVNSQFLVAKNPITLLRKNHLKSTHNLGG